MNALIALILFLAITLLPVAGWITHVIWTFNQGALTNVLLGILGALSFPIGALHGIYLWF